MLSAITRPRCDRHELNCHQCHPQESHETSQPIGRGCEYEVFELRARGEQLGGNERTRGVSIESVLYIELQVSAILFVSDDDLVCASAEGNSLAGRVHAHPGVALQDAPPVYKHLNTVVRPGVQVDGLRLR